MKERWAEVLPDAGEKQEAQFENWLSGKGIPFISPEAEDSYRERVTLMKDAIQLQRTPSRIPICPSVGFFPIQYAGVTMYDYDILTRAWEQYCHDFTPDAYNVPTTIVPGKVLDILDFKLYRWPGRGLSEEQDYQPLSLLCIATPQTDFLRSRQREFPQITYRVPTGTFLKAQLWQYGAIPTHRPPG